MRLSGSSFSCPSVLASKRRSRRLFSEKPASVPEPVTAVPCVPVAVWFETAAPFLAARLILIIARPTSLGPRPERKPDRHRRDRSDRGDVLLGEHARIVGDRVEWVDQLGRKPDRVLDDLGQ